ncbi:MAG: flippase-like domain-containing protein [Acidimicrobiales bacterium]
MVGRLGRGRLVRWVLGVALGVAALATLLAGRGELAAARARLTHPALGPVAAAVGLEAASLIAYALAQRRALATAVRVPLARLVVVSLANDALALTVPGEPAVSSAYRYAQYRRAGVEAPVAGWAVVTVMVAQAVALSTVLALGIVVALLSAAHPPALASTLVLLAVVLVAGASLLQRNRAVRLLAGAVRLVRWALGTRRPRVLARVEDVLAQMREVDPGRAGLATVIAWAAGAWLADAACLAAAFAAVHAALPWRALLLAYGVAQILAVLPLAPGGLGVVEGGLAFILIAYGTPHAAAVAAVLAYRLITYWGAAAVGWAAFALQVTRRARGPAPTVSDGRGRAGRITP